MNPSLTGLAEMWVFVM